MGLELASGSGSATVVPGQGCKRFERMSRDRDNSLEGLPSSEGTAPDLGDAAARLAESAEERLGPLGVEHVRRARPATTRDLHRPVDVVELFHGVSVRADHQLATALENRADVVGFE